MLHLGYVIVVYPRLHITTVRHATWSYALCLAAHSPLSRIFFPLVAHFSSLWLSYRGGQRCGLTSNMGPTKEVLESTHDHSGRHHERCWTSLKVGRHRENPPFSALLDVLTGCHTGYHSYVPQNWRPRASATRCPRDACHFSCS